MDCIVPFFIGIGAGVVLLAVVLHYVDKAIEY